MIYFIWVEKIIVLFHAAGRLPLPLAESSPNLPMCRSLCNSWTVLLLWTQIILFHLNENNSLPQDFSIMVAVKDTCCLTVRCCFSTQWCFLCSMKQMQSSGWTSWQYTWELTRGREKYKELYFACPSKESIKWLLECSAVSTDGDKDEKKFLKTVF